LSICRAAALFTPLRGAELCDQVRICGHRRYYSRRQADLARDCLYARGTVVIDMGPRIGVVTFVGKVGQPRGERSLHNPRSVVVMVFFAPMALWAHAVACCSEVSALISPSSRSRKAPDFSGPRACLGGPRFLIRGKGAKGLVRAVSVLALGIEAVPCLADALRWLPAGGQVHRDRLGPQMPTKVNSA
jgi:hypothetical protein